ncbi:hypothetical protein ONZ45_g14393 [Pleurotus djamor]|nr:hypothetical protein ONZ45_g14393 [Pleurotus djamor]
MLGRATRSGKVFSPWGATTETRYELALDLTTIIPASIDRSEDPEEDDTLGEPVDTPALDRELRTCSREGEARPLAEDAPSASVPFGANRNDRRDSVASPLVELECHSTTPIASGHGLSPTGLSRAEKRKLRSTLQKRGKRRETRFNEQAQNGLSAKAISIRRAQAAKHIGIPDQKGKVLKDNSHVVAEQLARKGLRDLLDEGFELIEWDGMESLCMVDCMDRVVVCGGTPRDDSWPNVATACAESIEEARSRCQFTDKQRSHRRGAFPALAAGFAFGLGLQRPSNLTDRNVDNSMAMKSILTDKSIKRVAGFQSGLLDAYLPDLSSYYRKTMDGLQKSQPELKKNFTNTQFSSITVNFGPQTVSIPHLDYANLSTGMCAITALGDFDPDVGGHLVLWELRIILRFPVGSTVLIPSALIHHSNLPIQPHEKRYSITQYSAGGLFRWVENGYCSDKDCTIDKSQHCPWEEGIERLRLRRVGQTSGP